MNSITLAGKFLDQPNLLNRFQKAVPAILIGGGAFYAYKDIKQAPQDEKKKKTLKNFFILSATILSALSAPYIAEKIIKNVPESATKLTFDQINKQNIELITDFIKNNKISENAQNILNKAKEKVLNIFEIKTLFNEICTKKEGKKFLDTLIPDPENIDSKHIFSEIGRLSILGLIPVLGGIIGGITGDILTEKNWKERIPDKIKEGSYQYLANIFLCNIGAAGALMILEKKNIQSKAARAIGMIAGIIATGVVGGSAIANFIGSKIINPLFNKGQQNQGSLFSERTPEPIDIGLHADDVATVAVMSGLKWIEPALPILYSISGYRAGIGYRNGDKETHGHKHKHQNHHKHSIQRSHQLNHTRPQVFLSFGNNTQQ